MATPPKPHYLISPSGYAAVSLPPFQRIESRLNSSGLAVNASRCDLKAFTLIMNFTNARNQSFVAGRDAVLLRADASLQPWAKQAYNFDDAEFVLVPEAAIQGYQKANP
jgi:hypothetical protein